MYRNHIFASPGKTQGFTVNLRTGRHELYLSCEIARFSSKLAVSRMHCTSEKAEELVYIIAASPGIVTLNG
jgi:hypothetical protein